MYKKMENVSLRLVWGQISPIPIILFKHFSKYDGYEKVLLEKLSYIFVFVSTNTSKENFINYSLLLTKILNLGILIQIILYSMVIVIGFF
jgi:hypothetical protein